MSKMIDIQIDERKFVFCRQTLDLTPEFVITQILNGTASVDDYPFIERTTEQSFRIDTSPYAFEKIAHQLRSKGDGQLKVTLMITKDVQNSQLGGGDKEKKDNEQINKKLTDDHQADDTVELSAMDPTMRGNKNTQSQEIRDLIQGMKEEDTRDSTDVHNFTDMTDLAEFTERDQTQDQNTLSQKSASQGTANIFSKTSERSVKNSESAFDPLNMLNTKASPIKMDKIAEKHDTGIFRRPDVVTDVHRGGVRARHTKTDVYVDFSAMSSDNNLSDVNTFVGKMSKKTLSQNNNVTSSSTNTLSVVPKGHHVYKSRKIELDTSEDRR